MNNITIPILVIAATAVGFFGGVQYGQSHATITAQRLQNLPAEQRQQLFQQIRSNGGFGGGVAGAGRRGGQAGGGFMNGDILSKDDKSITVKMRDGGSKIVFFSPSTMISKTIIGGASDLEVGKQVMVSGSTNSDGSVTAQFIQVPSTPPLSSQ